MSWTDDRVETLKRMWSEGQSASAIAKELGGVTRNAVIGKVHRLGLSNRTEEPEAAAPAPAPAPEPVAREKPAAPRAVPQPAAAPLRPEPAPDPVAVQPEPEPEPSTQPAFVPVPRRPIVPAGQPLPPQPSANEISPEALASVREVEKRAKKLTLMELTERTCKWPIGDPATDKFWFCGLPSVAGKPYCEAHVGVAFQPMSSRRDRRR
ncbi:GcrA family cell cycle regulator [uncultured Paracoccus sp.]|jgi:GcrA cell cycle regulator|uniref:GcrA family cell cycle regulator n=1 Tax=uncultured Paracoccus sp. TaxID=189685 RepID=UPI0025E32544|nr:GcrA family cell cycle regulator [uncultured Paracoccus sp.]